MCVCVCVVRGEARSEKKKHASALSPRPMRRGAPPHAPRPAHPRRVHGVATSAACDEATNRQHTRAHDRPVLLFSPRKQTPTLTGSHGHHLACGSHRAARHAVCGEGREGGEARGVSKRAASGNVEKSIAQRLAGEAPLSAPPQRSLSLVPASTRTHAACAGWGRHAGGSLLPRAPGRGAGRLCPHGRPRACRVFSPPKPAPPQLSAPTWPHGGAWPWAHEARA